MFPIETFLASEYGLKKREVFLKALIVLILIASSGFCYTNAHISPKEALQRLMNGNRRFASGDLEHPNRSQERREATRAKQAPYAVVVSCSDSRVSPEIIFDEGVGDLFVVRVAGNVIGPLELESIEYAAQALQSVLILVLGHEQCGAVDAVVEGKTKDLKAISLIVGPAIREARERDPKHLLETSIQDNALNMKKLLLQSEALGKLAGAGQIDIEAGYYNLQSGLVQLL